MKINDNELNNIIKDKLSSDLEISNLSNITILKIDFIFNYIELLKIPSLEELRFNSIEIEEGLLQVLNQLPNLKRLYFINCDINSLEVLDNKLELLYIERCKLSFTALNKFNKLKSLSLVEMDNIDLNSISVIKNIENINFLNSKIINEDSLIYLNKVVKFCITGIVDIDNLIGIDSLKKLVIDEDVYSSNLDVVKYLINKGVDVTNIYGESFGDING